MAGSLTALWAFAPTDGALTPLTAAPHMMTTIQMMLFFLRAVHGNSAAFCGGPNKGNNAPFHGVCQGGNGGPACFLSANSAP